jgi:HAMP domain-containing protein
MSNPPSPQAPRGKPPGARSLADDEATNIYPVTDPRAADYVRPGVPAQRPAASMPPASINPPAPPRLPPVPAGNAGSPAGSDHTLPGPEAKPETLPGGVEAGLMGIRMAGRYQILGQIGRGGMATVFKAHDPGLGRDVAVKFLHATLCADEEYRARFLREARAAGGLSHPNIVTVHDVGEIDGRPYMAMELLEGQTLSDTMQEGQALPVRDVIIMGIQLSRALDYAHSRGVVHRDIKPGNIMLVKATRTIKVADFGIAHVDTPGATQRTRVGDIIGTPQYMSPEQAMGEKLDGRSDLFSLGIVLYQMLTGQRPFQGEGLVALVMKITHEEPPPMEKLRPNIPPALRRVVERCLSKERDKRFQTGRELTDALIKVLGEVDAEVREKTQAQIVPLRVKWAAMMALIVAVVMALTAALITQRQYAAMMAQVTDYGSSLSRFIAAQNAASALGDDWVSVDVALQAIMNTRDFHSVTVVDNQGIVRASSHAALAGQPYKPPSSQSLGLQGAVAVTRYVADGEQVLGFEAPITFQGKGIGRVALGVPEKPLTQVARLSIVLMVILVLVTVAAVAAAMYFVGDWFAKPIKLVAESMGEVAKGRFDHRIREQRKDEFGLLYTAFDQMAQALQDRQAGAGTTPTIIQRAPPTTPPLRVAAAADGPQGPAPRSHDKPPVA